VSPNSPFTGTVELQPGFAPRPAISHIIFDFDGTLSWLRHGWPEIMLHGWLPLLPGAKDETDAHRRDLLMGIILGLNGQPTIRQMIRFAELVQQRGGPAHDPEQLRAAYQARLDREIATRSELIRSGRATADDFVVHGARPLLQQLRRAGFQLMVLSSTHEVRVREEAELLQLTEFFDDRIVGSPANPEGFSKMAELKKLLRETGVPGSQLLSFGDGPVEMAATKELGGVSIAVCSDENPNGSGAIDDFKRRQLLDAGADAVIPDFRDAWALVQRLCPQLA
jgi:phosphoglycolate phosphatase-like HAD superfamily hydrolase